MRWATATTAAGRAPTVAANARANPNATSPHARPGGPQRVAFDVTTDGEKVIVVLDRKTLEPALINVAFARAVMMGVISHRVGRGDPAHEAAHLAALIGPQHQVPVVRHQLIGEQVDVVSFESFAEDPLERFVVGAKETGTGPGYCFFGLPGDRKVDSRPSVTAVFSIQSGLP